MPDVYLITHPDVIKSPDVAVPRWPLSPRGRQRMTAMLARPWVAGLGAVYCSAERKAIDGATILAGHLGIDYVELAELGEVDRSSTGFLPEAEHAEAARLLFERPDESVRGWETAHHAQARMIAAMESVPETEFLLRNSASNPDRPLSRRDVAVVAHGGVGAFYLCHLKGVPISRDEAQPGRDGGYYYCFDAETRTLRHGWTRIDPA